jgi:hypothetical protein
LAQALFGPIEHIVKTVNLPAHRIIGDDAMPNLRNLPAKEVNRANGDAGRRWDAEESSIHSTFPESVVDELRQCFERLIGVGALCAQYDR